MPRNTPVKYHRWIEQAPDWEEDHVSYDGNPMICLAVCVIALGGVCAIAAWVGTLL